MSIDIEKIARECGFDVSCGDSWLEFRGDRDGVCTVQVRALATAIIEQCARAVTDYAMSHSFDENDRTMICGAEDAIRALKPAVPPA